jgi:hypothetical protein
MKLVKRYDKNGKLVYWHADLTMAESQPDWIIEAARQRKAKKRAQKLKTRKRNGV